MICRERQVVINVYLHHVPWTCSVTAGRRIFIGENKCKRSSTCVTPTTIIGVNALLQHTLKQMNDKQQMCFVDDTTAACYCDAELNMNSLLVFDGQIYISWTDAQSLWRKNHEQMSTLELHIPIPNLICMIRMIESSCERTLHVGFQVAAAMATHTFRS